MFKTYIYDMFPLGVYTYHVSHLYCPITKQLKRGDIPSIEPCYKDKGILLQAVIKIHKQTRDTKDAYIIYHCSNLHM